MRLGEDFALVSSEIDTTGIGHDFEELVNGHVADVDVSLTKILRARYHELNVTTVANVPLLAFASLGHATATLDTESEQVFRWRGWIPPYSRDGQGALGDAVFFGKYHYRWGTEDFLLYTITLGLQRLQYVLKEPDDGETTVSHCRKTDALITAAAKALTGDPTKFIYVYDRYWYRSAALYEEVSKASWDNVILNDKTKHALQDVSNGFFDSKEQYEKYGVPWKRGLIFHGPVGNGKTVSIKALMHDLMQRSPAIPTLYVKSAPSTFDVKNIFAQARKMAPCMLVMEDIETIVTSQSRSYFFNEVDGLENNNGILMVASTNYLDRLDPGLSKRPSRFDRKYLFPLPDHHERILYAHYWREKIRKRVEEIDFPEKLCAAIADITDEFSFAYVQEAFVATLLAMARGESDESEPSPTHRAYSGTYNFDYTYQLRTPKGEHPELDGYRFWRAFKTQVRSLRDDMGSGQSVTEDDKHQQVLDELRTLNMQQVLDELRTLNMQQATVAPPQPSVPFMQPQITADDGSCVDPACCMPGERCCEKTQFPFGVPGTTPMGLVRGPTAAMPGMDGGLRNVSDAFGRWIADH